MLYVDNSTLCAFARCPSEAIMRYHLGYTSPDESRALKCGSAVHTALEAWYKGGSTEDVLLLFEEQYWDWGIEHVPEKDRLAPENVYKILRRWLELNPVEGLPYRVHPDLVEIGFNQPLNEDIALVGRLDAAVSTWDQQWWYVLDHKTTRRIEPLWVRSFQLGSQMTGYIWALSQMMPNVIGAYINGIETSRLPSDPKRKCSTHGVKYAECGESHMNAELFITQRTPSQIEQWQRTAIELAYQWQALTEQIRDVQDIQEAQMVGTFSGACRYCEFHDFCAQGRQPFLTQNFVVSPWVPHEGIGE